MDATTTALAKILAGFGITLVFGATGAMASGTIPQQIAPPAPAPVSVSVPVTSGSSVNWSGYVAQSGTYTSVSGTWIVPSISNPSVNSADATWVGIGGVKSRDLIQAGTELVPTNTGGEEYRAWYELLPGNSQAIPLAVSPGDSVSVSITQDGGDEWLISFNDNTTGKSYQTSVTYNSSLSSAEWIEELPVAIDSPLSLDNFGTINFTSGFAIQNGTSVTIAQSAAKPLHMQNNTGQTVATPSAIGSDGESFAIARTSAAASPLSMTRSGRVLPTFAAGQTASEPQPQIQIVPSGHHGYGRYGSGRFIVRVFSD
jgi:hypothetical protein